MGHNSRDFIHPRLNEYVKAIGGEYVFIKEATLPVRGGEALYLIGCAVFNTTCCGTGGVCYAHVPGIISDWHYTTTPDDRTVSRVTPIVDVRTRNEIRQAIGQKETVHQIEFLP